MVLLSLVSLVQCRTQTAQLPQRPAIVYAEGERTDRETMEATGTHFAIATQGRYATKAAEEMYKLGGNIIDAAVSASFVISVERPQSTGLGGGGFMLYRNAKTSEVFAIDFRERAPLKASEKMYIDASGKPVAAMSRNGILSAAVPGLVAGLLEIHQRFGHLPLAQVMAPAIRLAQEGFAIYPELEKALLKKAPVLAQDPAARAIFLAPDGQAWPEGHILMQTDLAQTLRAISKHRLAGFYSGPVANEMVKCFKDRKGLLTREDLRSYKVKWRAPLWGTFDGYDVYSMPPPSSGGVHVIQFLNMLESDHLHNAGYLSADAIHLGASALQAAFADRARYLGDPDFVSVPVHGLISKDYAKKRRAEFAEGRARHVTEVQAGQPLPYESTETTHMSLLDEEGNAVSTTQTINGWMGASVVVPHTGVLLNNEMDDFSAQEGASNMFGAIGGQANAIAPRKTPLSSMSPTILLRDGQTRMVLGAPGGTHIISCVAQTILNYIEMGLPLYDSVASIRYHHQWQPDVLTIDPPGPSPAVLTRLRGMGYTVDIRPVGCDVMAVTREAEKLHAVADPRDIGTSVAH